MIVIIITRLSIGGYDSSDLEAALFTIAPMENIRLSVHSRDVDSNGRW